MCRLNSLGLKLKLSGHLNEMSEGHDGSLYHVMLLAWS